MVRAATLFLNLSVPRLRPFLLSNGYRFLETAEFELEARSLVLSRFSFDLPGLKSSEGQMIGYDSILL